MSLSKGFSLFAGIVTRQESNIGFTCRVLLFPPTHWILLPISPMMRGIKIFVMRDNFRLHLRGVVQLIGYGNSQKCHFRPSTSTGCINVSLVRPTSIFSAQSAPSHAMFLPTTISKLELLTNIPICNDKKTETACFRRYSVEIMPGNQVQPNSKKITAGSSFSVVSLTFLCFERQSSYYRCPLFAILYVQRTMMGYEQCAHFNLDVWGLLLLFLIQQF